MDIKGTQKTNSSKTSFVQSKQILSKLRCFRRVQKML